MATERHREPAEPAAPGASEQLDTHVRCVKCGYDLYGLPREGLCPECGTPVADSTQGTFLRFSSIEYLKKLHLGVFLIQALIIVQIVLAIGAMVVLGLSGGAGWGWSEALVSIVTAALNLGLLYGWWLVSEPDPRYTGEDTGQKPRRIVRSMVAVSAGIGVLSLVLEVGLHSVGPVSLYVALGVVELVVYVVRFFAGMMYLKWVGQRIPNAKVVKRAGTLMWLGPVLMTVGLLLFGLGPLIALVLYWNMLDWVRRDLKAIRATKEAGSLHEAA